MTFDERYAAIQSRDARFDGQFVTAVSSTGIYCRPSCPARTPKPANVEEQDVNPNSEDANSNEKDHDLTETETESEVTSGEGSDSSEGSDVLDAREVDLEELFGGDDESDNESDEEEESAVISGGDLSSGVERGSIARKGLRRELVLHYLQKYIVS